MTGSYLIFFFLDFFLVLIAATPFPHSESCLDLSARGRGGGAADAVLDIAESVIQGIIDGVNEDNERRSNFTQDIVTSLYAQDPTFNYIIVHTSHTIDFNGTQGVDWGQRHQELDLQVGGMVGYEIYTFRAGEFTLNGDGGYLNWSFLGKSVSDTGGRPPRTVVFASPVQ